MLVQRGFAASTLRREAVVSARGASDEAGPLAVVESLPVRAALIVDDEALIAMALAEYCRDLGVEAFAASDPFQALEILDRHPEVEALVTDVRMPGMNGPELARRAVAARPDLAVLFITGFTAEGDLADAGDWPVLRKPFDLGALGPALARALALR
jgi:CheY-like chemotaxis protein